MEDDFDAYMAGQLEDPEYRAAYEDARAREDILDALLAARKDAGLTQTEVARRMGIRQPSVSQMEREGSDPHLSTVQHYARAIGRRIRFEVDTE